MKLTQSKFYKATYVPTLMYGDETWVETKRSLRSVETAETRFLRSVKDCSRLDKVSSHDMRSELGVRKLREWK
jgi:hypothetical protein